MTDKEKLLKLKKLADAMYYAAQQHTTDASRLHKAMDEYHQFLIYEYYKEEPTIPDIVDEHFDEMLGEESASEDLEEAAKNYMRSQNPPIWGLYHGFKAGAQWQKQQMTKEPISEDWEKAAKHYLYSNILYDDVYVGNPTDKDCIEMFKAGAKWQKEQDKQWLAENHKHIFAKGRESAEVWISADDDVNNAAEKTTRRFCKISLLSGDYLSLAEAQPQVNKESKLIAIKSFVCGAQWDRNKLMKEAVDGKVTGIGPNVNGEVYDKSQKRISTTYTADNVPYCELGDKVKLIILKEE